GNIGDIDGDGLEDIAVSSAYETVPQIYIFKGRSSWPATLAASSADYTIAADSTFNNAVLGYPIVKMGDINGDGVGDFALGAGQYSGTGAVVVVLGAKPFSGGGLSAMVTAGKAFVVTNSTARGFGTGVTVLGGTNGTLVVGAPYTSSSTGRVATYKWSGSSLTPVGT